MNELRSKKVSESATEQVHLLMDRDMNGAGRLYGGQLLYWIDEVASVVAMRHSNRNVITVSVEKQHFKKPCHLGDMVVLMGQVVYVGNTSMQIRVNSFVEDKQGMRRLINTAYFTMVALDDNDRPTKAPGLIIENESEQAEYTAAKNRVALSKKELI